MDNDFDAIKTISKNSIALGIANKITTQVSTLPNGIEKLYNSSFDLMFFDPPYDRTNELLFDFINLSVTNNVVSKDGIIVVESQDAITDKMIPSCANIFLQRKSSGKYLSFIRRIKGQ